MNIAEYTFDELYSLAQDFGIPGRSEMNKDDLVRNVREKIGDPFGDLADISTGDQVEMNHLSGSLIVTDRLDGDNFTALVMETNRGGRHKLVADKDEPLGKNGDSPHLERWRAGDEEWMYNSTDPLYIKLTAKSAEIN